MIFKNKPIKEKRISQLFHTGKKPEHKGIDFAASNGTAVRAVADGVVVAAGYSPWDSKKSYGYQVAIKHADGSFTNYAHLKKGGIKVALGAKVKSGQLIAYSNNTGASTGPHLHFELHLRAKWNRVDAMPWIEHLGKDPEKLYNYVVSTNGGSLKVRATADAEAKVVGKLPNGTKIHVIKFVDNWAHIDRPEKGYVHTDYIKKKK